MQKENVTEGGVIFLRRIRLYVLIHVIKHDMDPNSNISYRRKIGPVASSQYGFSIFLTYGQLMAVREKSIMKYKQILSSVFSCFF